MASGITAESKAMSDKAVERFFGEYNDLHHAILDWRLAYSIVKRLACPLSGRTVLDYGCGKGRFTRLLRDRGARVIGVDISQDALEQAHKSDDRLITYHLINSGDLTVVPARGVDVAVSTFVLCCVRERPELDRIVKSIYGRLRSGCCYVLAEPHPDGTNRQFYSMRRTAPKGVSEGTPLEVQVISGAEVIPHDFWHSKDAYVDMLRQAGFSVEHVIEPTMNTYPDEPYWQDERRYPPFMIFRARK